MKYNKQRITPGLLAALLAFASLASFSPTVAAEAFPGLNGRIIFSDVNGFDLRSIRPDGTDRQDVSAAAGDQTDAEYSPDGTKIVYRQIVSSVDQVFVADADGSNPQQVTTGTDFCFTPSWSPDGSKIVYIRQVGGAQRIHTMNADGSNDVQVSSTTPYFDPEYSPDGSKIVALLDASDDEVVVMNIDGGGIVNLTNNGVDDLKASWSPDGSKLIYASDVHINGRPEVFTMNPDGTGKTQLTNENVGYHGPVYSPDGTKVAFADIVAPSSIYVMNADGTNLMQVPDSTWAREVSWQPLTHRPSSSTPNPTVSLSNGAATIDIASMYTDTYEGIDETTVAVTSTPASGTTSVDGVTGVITYSVKTTAAHSSFWGNMSSLFFPTASAATTTDSFTYRVCSLANSSLCSTGTITVNLLSAPTTGAGQPGGNNIAWVLATLSVSSIGLGLHKLRRRHYGSNKLA